MRRYIVTIILAVVSFSATTAQNPLQGEPSLKLEQKAEKAAKEWTRELAMSLEQMELMQDKIIEFAMQKNKVIQSDLPAEEKTRIINELQEREYSDMRDILTRQQFLRYMEINNARARQINEQEKNP